MSTAATAASHDVAPSSRSSLAPALRAYRRLLGGCTTSLMCPRGNAEGLRSGCQS